MIRPIPALAVFLALTACTRDPGFTGVSGVREITAAEAQSCTYLTDIRGRPPVYGPLAQQGLEYNRNQVMATARDSGANAIVFGAVSPGAQVYEVEAKAYRC